MKNSIDQNDAEAPSSGSSTGFLTILWRRRALVFFGLAVGLVVGLLFYLQKPPTYQSQARLVVMKRRADPLPMSNGGDWGREKFIEDYVSTQEAIIKSHIVWNRAAAKLKNDPLRMAPPANDYVGFIERGLKVARDKDSNSGVNNNVLNISFSGGSPEDCMTVVNAVIEGYRDSLTGAVNMVTDDNFNQILKGRDTSERKLLEAQKEYETVHEQIRDKNTLTLADLKNRIGLNENERFQLEKAKISLQSRIKLIHKGIVDGEDKSALMALFQMSGAKGRDLVPETPKTPEETKFALELQEAELLQRVGPDHPDVVSLRKRASMINEYLSKSFKKPQTDSLRPPTDPLELYVKVLEQELTANELQTKSLQVKLDEDRAAVQSLDKFVVNEKLLWDKCERFRKTLDNYEERKQQLELTRDAPLFDANVITPAGVGGKVSPILMTTLTLSGFLGLVLGSSLAYLAEISDKSFRSIEEVRQRLGLTVIGQVPALTAHEPSVIEEDPLDPMLIAHHSPKSIQAEAYRGVRTSLYFSTRGKGHQVIQVTSPNPGDGKSTLIANLAASIAQSGRKVVLMDADFRKPRVHKIFGLGNAEVGLASVIAGEAELESAIYTCEVPGLSILPCGPRPTNPADLLTSALFSEIIDEVKKDFDFVLIDTPPLLAVSDPAVVAPRVDGVILTIRMGKNSRPMAEQATERLTILGANVLGVVVNGMDELRSYGNYGYGYSYGYSYAYTYGDESESSTKLNQPR